MIKYSLRCHQGHEFESWFQSGAAFDTQVTRGLVACPLCASTEVTKAIMAPALSIQTKKRTGTHEEAAAASDKRSVALLDPEQQAHLAMLRSLRHKILTETDNVGDRFPEEARRIHEGSIPERAIHGHATLEEAEALIQDGIRILPLPVLPEDFN